MVRLCTCQCCHQTGKRVLYIRFPELLEKCHQDKKTGKTMMSIVKKYVKYDLMVFDEYMMYDFCGLKKHKR